MKNEKKSIYKMSSIYISVFVIVWKAMDEFVDKNIIAKPKNRMF